MHGSGTANRDVLAEVVCSRRRKPGKSVDELANAAGERAADDRVGEGAGARGVSDVDDGSHVPGASVDDREAGNDASPSTVAVTRGRGEARLPEGTHHRW